MTFVAQANTGADVFGTSRSVSKPAGAASGDIGVFYLGRWDSGASFPAVTPPTGVVLRGTVAVGQLQLLVYLVYVGAESSYVFSWTGQRWSALRSMFFTGRDQALALATVPFHSLTGSGLTIGTTTVTTVADADLAWDVDTHEYSGGETHAPPLNFTEAYDLEHGAGAYRVSPGTGDQSAIGGTISALQNYAVALLALAPAATGGVTGTVAVTQAADVAAGSGVLGYSGTATPTQAANTASASGVASGPVSGTAAATQADNTAVASGKLAYAGTAAASQAADTATAAGKLVYSGTAGVNQASQTAAAVGVTLGDIVLRPDEGMTARPTTGITSRPGAGLTARVAAGVTQRPFTGITQ